MDVYDSRHQNPWWARDLNGFRLRVQGLGFKVKGSGVRFRVRAWGRRA